jgi:DNA-binding NtrC family response regulator
MAATLPNPVGMDDAFGPWHQHSVLVVDDEPGMRNFLTRALAARCEVVDAAATVAEAMRLMEQRPYDLLVLDIAMPGKSGVEWLHELRDVGYQGDVILITAYADLETAIGALRGGASDFILKPFRIDQILNAIGRCFDSARLQRENYLLRREIAARAVPAAEGVTLVGDSAAMRDLRGLVQRLAPVPSTVLIAGPSGTGKEVAARALHQLSPRAGQPFVAINCAAMAPELIESELFGHLKGAFTGAGSAREGLFFFAQGGTLLLDEVAELPMALQGKLLRVLEEKRVRPVGSEQEIPVDVRVIASTNRDLARAVAEGYFRQDLYYRLDVVHLHIPSLAERPEDIEPLARHFMRQLSGQLGVAPLALPPALLDRMRAYPWPGNARELRNVIERSLILGQFPLSCIGGEAAAPSAEPAPEEDVSLETAERRHILRVLAEAGGNKSEAARRLGVSRKTLERKCVEWGV